MGIKMACLPGPAGNSALEPTPETPYLHLGRPNMVNHQLEEGGVTAFQYVNVKYIYSVPDCSSSY